MDTKDGTFVRVDVPPETELKYSSPIATVKKGVSGWWIVLAAILGLVIAGSAVYFPMADRLDRTRGQRDGLSVKLAATRGTLSSVRSDLATTESALGDSQATVAVCQAAVVGTYKARNFAWAAAVDFRKAVFTNIFAMIAFVKEGDGHLAQSNQAFSGVRHEEYLCRTADGSGGTTPL